MNKLITFIYAITLVLSTALHAMEPSQQLGMVERETQGRALIDAAEHGDSEKIQTLISQGADVNYENHYHVTALIGATFHGQTECLRLLIDAQADLNHIPMSGYTALKQAAMDNRQEICEMLVEAAIRKQIEPKIPAIVAFLGCKRRETSLLNEWRIPRDVTTLLGQYILDAEKHAAGSALAAIQRIPNFWNGKAMKQHLLVKYFPAYAAQKR